MKARNLIKTLTKPLFDDLEHCNDMIEIADFNISESKDQKEIDTYKQMKDRYFVRRIDVLKELNRYELLKD